MPTALLKELAVAAAGSDGLSAAEARAAAEQLALPEVSEDDKRALLVAMNTRGETVTEITAFAQVFRELARDPGLGEQAARAIDIVGTGGDKSGSYNVSSTAAFVVAAAGVPVLKHGNRSVTSKCGSADLLAAVGIDLEADLPTTRRSAEELNFAFFYAPAYHPAFKGIMPVRRALADEGRRTIFNLLGPLINPARPAFQLMGVYPAGWTDPLAHVLGELGTRSGLVVHCDLGEGKGMDELTTAGNNRATGFGAFASYRRSNVDPAEPFTLAEAGLEPSPFEDLLGGDLSHNLTLLDKLMHGQAPRGLEDTVCLNAGAALWIVDRCSTLREGVAAAREILTGGALRRWLTQLKECYAG